MIWRNILKAPPKFPLQSISFIWKESEPCNKQQLNITAGPSRSFDAPTNLHFPRLQDTALVYKSRLELDSYEYLKGLWKVWDGNEWTYPDIIFVSHQPYVRLFTFQMNHLHLT